MRSHTQLDAWKKSIDLVTDIYRTTEHFPKDERYGLTSQLRRASVSIPANIAEGAGRKSAKDYNRFLSNAQGSASEVETELVIAVRLGYISEKEFEDFAEKLNNIGRMITGISNYLRRTIRDAD